jgi:type I restriction enzyme S subunit
LPDGWAWCRLGSICNYGSCDSISADNISDDDWILDLEDIEKGTARVLQFVHKRDRPFTSMKHSFSKGQVLYSKLRPYLNKVVVAPEDGYCTSEILPLSFNIEICPEYVRLFLMSDFFLAYANKCSYGVKMQRLGTTDGKKALFALPPLAEQKRIALTAIKSIEHIAILDREKDFLLEAVTTTRSKILSLAICGKLVPQDPTDESASVLLERIRTERESLVKTSKIKRGKADSVASRGDDNSYYGKLPDGWAVCRLIDIGQIIGGGTPSTNEPFYWDNGRIPWITPADLSGYNEKYIAEGSRKITGKGLAESSAVLMPAGSVLFSSRAPIGYCVIAKNEVCTNQGFKSVVPHITGMSGYIYYCLKAQIEEIRLRASGTTFKEISGTEFGNTIITLPPLAEQQRIVTAIEAAFQQLKQITEKVS